MSPALALLVAVALGAETRVDVGLATEARVRRLDPAPTPADRDSLNLTATPHLAVAATGALGSASARYAPRLTASDVGPDATFERMHEGDLRLQLAPGPQWSLDAFAKAFQERAASIPTPELAARLFAILDDNRGHSDRC